MRVTKQKIVKINLKKIIKKHIMRKIKRWIVPILVGFVAALFIRKTEKGKELLNKIPFLGDKAEA